MSEPTLAELLGRVVSTSLAGVNTAIPARVVQFYPKERKADLQPLIRKQMVDGSTIDYPTILSVPVCYPSSGTSMFYYPLSKGDSTLLVFSQVSTDNWLTSNGKVLVDPEDDTRFNISDAFCIPGVFPFPLSTTIWDSQTLTKDESSVIIKHNIGTAQEAEISIDQSGEIHLESPIKVSMKSPLLDVEGAINSTGTITATGTITSSVDVIAGLTSLKLHVHPATPPSSPGQVSGPPTI